MSREPNRRRGKAAGRHSRSARPPQTHRPATRQPKRQQPKKQQSSLGGDHVEGRQAVRELLRAGKRKVHEVLISQESQTSAALAEIVDLAGDRRVPVREVTPRKLDEAALTAAPQGVVAKAAAVVPVPLEALVRPAANKPPLVVATDGVTDPGNLGAILRTAEVAGATGVVLTRHRSASLTPAAMKAAAGAAEYLPIALVGGLPAALARLREAGLWVVGLDGHAPDGLKSLRVAAEPLVLVLGAEGRGLSELVERRCDQVVSIPVMGRIESLNVAAAAAIALFNIAESRNEQRR